MQRDIIVRLSEAIAAKHQADPAESYVAALSKAPKKPAQKLVEEAAELAIACVAEDKSAQIGEAADVIFHFLVLCESLNISWNDVMEELEKREGLSGLTEKANRKE